MSKARADATGARPIEVPPDLAGELRPGYVPVGIAEWDEPESLAEAIETLGESAVFKLAVTSLRNNAKNNLRADAADGGKKAAKVQAKIATAKALHDSLKRNQITLEEYLRRLATL